MYKYLVGLSSFAGKESIEAINHSEPANQPKRHDLPSRTQVSARTLNSLSSLWFVPCLSGTKTSQWNTIIVTACTQIVVLSPATCVTVTKEVKSRVFREYTNIQY
jgi:hypothetical protein